MKIQDAILILLPNIISRLISSRYADMDDQWYQSLNRSPLTPPGYVFGLVWPILYLLVGYVLVNLDSNNRGAPFFYANLLLNFSWLLIFNRYKSILGGLVTISLMVISLLAFFYLNTTQPNLNYILIPYLVWLLFANYLSLYLYQNNLKNLTTKL